MDVVQHDHWPARRQSQIADGRQDLGEHRHPCFAWHFGRLAFGIANKPAWLSFSTADGSLWGTPTASNTGTYSYIVISVADGKGGTASLTPFSITVSSSTLNNVTLTWTPPTMNTDGTAKATSVVIEGLAEGTWYLAMKAYNVPGIESAYTKEVYTTL